MNDFALDELIGHFKRGILWIIVKIMFFTPELKEEAAAQCKSDVVRIPGAFYGYNVCRGYRAIGKYFPNRCRIVRLDYILGYAKLTLLTACVAALLLAAAQHLL